MSFYLMDYNENPEEVFANHTKVRLKPNTQESEIYLWQNVILPEGCILEGDRSKVVYKSTSIENSILVGDNNVKISKIDFYSGLGHPINMIPNGNSIAIILKDKNKVRIQNCSFNNFIGIAIQLNGGSKTQEISITNNVFNNNFVSISFCENFLNSFFSANLISGGSYGIINNANGVRITNNNIIYNSCPYYSVNKQLVIGSVIITKKNVDIEKNYFNENAMMFSNENNSWIKNRNIAVADEGFVEPLGITLSNVNAPIFTDNTIYYCDINSNVINEEWSMLGESLKNCKITTLNKILLLGCEVLENVTLLGEIENADYDKFNLLTNLSVKIEGKQDALIISEPLTLNDNVVGINLSNYNNKEEVLKILDDNYNNKEEISSLLAFKADVTNVYTSATVDNKLSTKADVNSVYDKTDVDSKLLLKADVSEFYDTKVIDQKLSLKSDISSVYDKTEIDSKLLLKEQEITNLQNQKQDKLTASDQITLTNNVIGVNLSNYNNKEEIASSLLLKADIVDHYTSKEVDDLFKASSFTKEYVIETNIRGYNSNKNDGDILTQGCLVFGDNNVVDISKPNYSNVTYSSSLNALVAMNKASGSSQTPHLTNSISKDKWKFIKDNGGVITLNIAPYIMPVNFSLNGNFGLGIKKENNPWDSSIDYLLNLDVKSSNSTKQVTISQGNNQLIILNNWNAQKYFEVKIIFDAQDSNNPKCLIEGVSCPILWETSKEGISETYRDCIWIGSSDNVLLNDGLCIKRFELLTNVGNNSIVLEESTNNYEITIKSPIFTNYTITLPNMQWSKGQFVKINTEIPLNYNVNVIMNGNIINNEDSEIFIVPNNGYVSYYRFFATGEIVDEKQNVLSGIGDYDRLTGIKLNGIEIGNENNITNIELFGINGVIINGNKVLSEIKFPKTETTDYHVRNREKNTIDVVDGKSWETAFYTLKEVPSQAKKIKIWEGEYDLFVSSPFMFANCEIIGGYNFSKDKTKSTIVMRSNVPFYGIPNFFIMSTFSAKTVENIEFKSSQDFVFIASQLDNIFNIKQIKCCSFNNLQVLGITRDKFAFSCDEIYDSLIDKCDFNLDESIPINLIDESGCSFNNVVIKNSFFSSHVPINLTQCKFYNNYIYLLTLSNNCDLSLYNNDIETLVFESLSLTNYKDSFDCKIVNNIFYSNLRFGLFKFRNIVFYNNEIDERRIVINENAIFENCSSDSLFLKQKYDDSIVLIPNQDSTYFKNLTTQTKGRIFEGYDLLNSVNLETVSLAVMGYNTPIKDAPKDNKRYVRQNNKWVVEFVASEPSVEKTYNELKILKDSNELKSGVVYLITDYKTIFRRFTKVPINNNVNGSYSLINSSVVMPMYITANSPCTFNDEVVLKDYPNYKVFYHFEPTMSKSPLCDPNLSLGWIYRMIDENKNDVAWDFLNISFNRYQFNFVDTTIPAFGQEKTSIYKYDKTIAILPKNILVWEMLSDNRNGVVYRIDNGIKEELFRFFTKSLMTEQKSSNFYPIYCCNPDGQSIKFLESSLDGNKSLNELKIPVKSNAVILKLFDNNIVNKKDNVITESLIMPNYMGTIFNSKKQVDLIEESLVLNNNSLLCSSNNTINGFYSETMNNSFSNNSFSSFNNNFVLSQAFVGNSLNFLNSNVVLSDFQSNSQCFKRTVESVLFEDDGIYDNTLRTISLNRHIDRMIGSVCTNCNYNLNISCKDSYLQGASNQEIIVNKTYIVPISLGKYINITTNVNPSIANLFNLTKLTKLLDGNDILSLKLDESVDSKIISSFTLEESSGEVLCYIDYVSSSQVEGQLLITKNIVGFKL